MNYIAHKKDGREQTVKEHLENTAVLASDFAVDKLKGIAYTLGLTHDIGKYSQDFAVDEFKGISYTPGLIHDIGKYAQAYRDRILHDSFKKSKDRYNFFKKSIFL